MTAISDFERASLRSGIRTLYSAPDEQTAGIRAAQLNSVVRLTPQTMAANMGSSSMVVWAFRADVPAGMWMWWFSLLVVSGLGLLSWWRGRLKVKTMASPRTLHRATVHAAVLSGLWAVLPLMWFAHVSPARQLAAVGQAGCHEVQGFLVSRALPMDDFVRFCRSWSGHPPLTATLH